MASRSQHLVDAELDCATRNPLRVAWTAAALVTSAVTVVAEALMRLTDPHIFPNIGLGLRWAIQTTTTVGCGAAVPTSVAGRIVVAVVMIVGLGFIIVSTAAIAGAFIESARRSGQERRRTHWRQKGAGSGARWYC